jgi:cytochrome c553
MMLTGGGGVFRTTIGAALALLAAGALANAPPPVKGDRELGEYLSSMCVACHQLSGRVSGSIPAIVAWPSDQFVAVIQSYKDGTRDNETMRTISHRLSQDEIEALAAYFGSLPAPKTP